MGTAAKFDLEAAVAVWRRFHSSARGLSPEDLEELEAHLRDEVEALVEEGRPVEAAYQEAQRRMGDYATTEAAYEQVYWRKVRAEHLLPEELLIRLAMLKNYLKIALRNLGRYPGYTVINVTGLGIGLATCLLIALYVYDEGSYDRFHQHADRIYRLERITQEGSKNAFVSGPTAPALQDAFPAVTATSRLHRIERLMRYGDRQFFGEQVAYVDPAFLKIFSFPLLQGDSGQVLTAPHSLVIKRSLAERYFGDEDPLGKTIRLDNTTDYTVTGIVEDVPSNSHLRFDALAPFTDALEQDPWIENWRAYGVRAYALLAPSAQPASVYAGMPSFLENHEGADELFLRPLKEIHLYTDTWEIDPQGNIDTVYLFSAVALFILLLACINYMNLATARAARRAREVGMRKALGAGRGQLIRQFLGESVLLALVALVVGLGLAWLALPLLNTFAGRDLGLSIFLQPKGLVLLLSGAVLVGVLAGSYPAFYLTRFQPARVLKGSAQSGRSGSLLRNGLVVIQFVVSITLLIATAVILQQLRFMQTKHLGFEHEHILNVYLHDARLVEDAERLTSALRSDAQVIDATLSSTGVGEVYLSTMVGPAGAQDDEDRQDITNIVFVDAAFLPTLDIELAAGRNFHRSQEIEGDWEVILNETAVRSYGWSTPEEAIGQRLASNGFNTEPVVVGVIRDFHFRSLRSGLRSMMLSNSPPPKDAIVSVRLQPGNAADAVARVEALWKGIYPDWPFDYAFLDEELQARYSSEQQRGRLFVVFTILAVFIACLGLFGLASFVTAQRTKEIGVRKVLGASIAGIVTLLSKDFLKLVLLGFVVASSIAYVALDRWLEDFAYRVEITWWVFALVGLAALLLAFLTVSYHTIRAATADPVRSLRYE